MNNLYSKMAEKKIKEDITEEATEQEIVSKSCLIKELEIDILEEFYKHVFSKISVEKYQELKESIERNGIYTPIIVREKDTNKYEIISGHNRVSCLKELGIKTVMANVIECDDDKATLIMIETNICQREDIALTEKGEAYKLQLEIIKKIKENHNSNNPAQFEQGYSIEELSKKSNDSRATIQRLIRLVELIKPLKEKVNSKILPMSIGVEFSYISTEGQRNIDKVITEKSIKLSMIQAETLRSNKEELTEQKIIDILFEKPKSEPKFTGKIQKGVYKKYKDRFSSDVEFSKVIDELLESYFNKQESNV